MDSYGSLSKLSVLNFHNKYRKELERNYNLADPLFDVWMTLQENSALSLTFRCSNKITCPCQERLMKFEQNLEYVYAGLTEKRKKGIY